MSESHSISNLKDPLYRVGALLYFKDAAGRLLLMKRKRPPNAGLWCAVGGKLEMSEGESPYECAVREAKEEVGVALQASDLSLRCILSEKNYQGTGHWLMFLFQSRRPLATLPKAMEEGEFRFASPEELSEIRMPELDRRLLSEHILSNEDSLYVLRCDRLDGPIVEEGRVV